MLRGASSRSIAGWWAIFRNGPARRRMDLISCFRMQLCSGCPTHAALYPALFGRVAAGGALAVQIPADFNALPHQLMRHIAPPQVRVKEWYAHDPAFYYDVL